MKTQIKSLILAAVVGLFGAMSHAQDATIPAPADVTIKTIGLNADGSLVGKISTAISSFDSSTPAEELSVSISRNGKILGEAKTDENGRFEIKNVQAGRYNLLAYGDQALLATGVEISEPAENSIVMELVAMPAPLKVATTVLSQYSKQMAAAKPLEVAKTKMVSVNVISPTVSEGTVNGRVSDLNGEMIENANVLLIQGNKIVAKSVAAKGTYSFDSVKAGVYTVMAVAESGFSVFGLEVVASKTISNASFKQEPSDITLVEGQTQDILPNDNDQGIPVIDDGFGAPIIDGGFAGGGGGFAGGGGGIGGGGGSGLGLGLGAAGIALGAAALGDNDRRASPF